MKIKYFHISVLLIILISLLSCSKDPVYSNIPNIEYKDFYLYYDIDALGNKELYGELVFSLIDGNGDIGYEEYDTLSTNDTSKVYTKLYIKIDGEFQDTSLITTLNYRIPYITPEGKNKTLKAEVKRKFEYSATFFGDTIKYEFYVIDRALNKSNIEQTPAIVLPLYIN
ncbi:MAG: hypothetical protein KAT68_19370 [Bacteroidales bacterium]|nr:hypothetical protein [Bacteroidales bacterium]